MTTHELFDPAINSLYMPSQSVPNAREFFAAWAQDSEALRAKYPPQVLAYGAGEHETIDVFEPSGTVKATVLFIHGGYWKAFYKDHFSYLAAPLLDAGLRVAVMSYDLAPAVNLAHITGQAQRATALIAQTYAGPLIVTGHSAGGHLAAMMHATDWAAHGLPHVNLAGGIGISGLYDLAPLRHTELQPDLKFTDQDVKTLSPIRLNPTSQTPFIVAVGELESSAFHAQSKLLTDTWLGVASPPHILKQRHHFNAPDDLLSLVRLIPLDS